MNFHQAEVSFEGNCRHFLLGPVEHAEEKVFFFKLKTNQLDYLQRYLLSVLLVNNR
jgi:hypothetical protein